MARKSLRRRIDERLAANPDVGAVRRPVTPDARESFDLYYVRSGPPSEVPLLVIPGGPGVASVQTYRGLRRSLAARGVDVVMMEHRGVGMSRCDDDGADLPPEAMTVDQVVNDAAAVLDALGVDTAAIYGTSYGSYLAAGIGVRHPDRVAAMVLDSPVLSARDMIDVRTAIRSVLLSSSGPAGAQLQAKVHRLLASGRWDSAHTQVAATVYEVGGPAALSRQLDLLLDGRTVLWRALEHLGGVAMRVVPYHNEMDLVNRIAFRELDYLGRPDGLPLDPSAGMDRWAELMPGAIPDFEGEPYDLSAAMPAFDWPTAVLSGGRDLTTPPAIAARVAALIPGAVLVTLPTAAHSLHDTRERAALRVAETVFTGRESVVPELVGLAGRGAELDALPANASVRLAGVALTAVSTAEQLIPGRWWR